MTWLYGMEAEDAKTHAHALLEAAARKVWGMEKLPELARGRKGKPYFPDFPDCHFNLSHSGRYALCALSDVPVGADIEAVRRRNARMLEKHLTESELAWCREEADPWPRFCLLWTRRESAVKRTGQGLVLPVRDIRVPLPPRETLDGVRFVSYTGEGWVASLCAAGELPRSIRWVGEEFLTG